MSNRSHQLFPRTLIHTVFCGCLVMSAAGCFTNNSANSSALDSSNYAAARNMIDRCGKIESRTASEVVTFIQERLLSGLSKRNAPRYPVELTMVACREPIAWALGNGRILFSEGLVAQLPNEAELAFVIAHELAHEVLHHQIMLSQPDGFSAPSTVARSLELEADKLALGVVAMAGYDPRGAISALQKLSNPSLIGTPIAGHPSTIERIRQLQQEITDSGWQPPGIVSRRSYQKLRAQLGGQITVESVRRAHD